MAFLGFLLTIAVHPWLIGGFVTLRWLVILPTVPLLVALRGVRPQLRWEWGIVLGWGALSLLWAPNGYLGADKLLHLVMFWLLWNLGDSRGLAKGMCLGLIVNALICVVQLAGYWPGPQAPHSVTSGLYLNRNMLAELAAPLAVWVIAARQWKFGLGPIACLILAPDRAAIVAVSVLCIMWRSWRDAYEKSKAYCRRLPLAWRSRIRLVGSRMAADNRAMAGRASDDHIGIAGRATMAQHSGIYAVATALIILIALFGILTYWKGVESFGQREVIWKHALEGMTLWGNGLNAYRVNFPYYEYVHCDPIEFVYELGIGAFPLAWLVWRGLRGDGPMEAKLAFAALLLESIFSFPLELPTTGVLAASLLGDLCHRRSAVPVAEPAKRVSTVRRPVRVTHDLATARSGTRR